MSTWEMMVVVMASLECLLAEGMRWGERRAGSLCCSHTRCPGMEHLTTLSLPHVRGEGILKGVAGPKV